jgi:hypothetical protein
VAYTRRTSVETRLRAIARPKRLSASALSYREKRHTAPHRVPFGEGSGKNLKKRFLGLLLGTIGKGVLEKAFEKSVKAIEARNGGARAARAS